MSASLSKLMRDDLADFGGYVAAEQLTDSIRLNANELPWRAPGDTSRTGLNRYPHRHSPILTQRIAEVLDVEADTVLITRGSDDAIDLLVRGFCRAGRDRIAICPPTFGMYAVSARLQGAEVLSVPLNSQFELDYENLVRRCDASTKIVFLCSPNNPTANSIAPDTILQLCDELAGQSIVVVDEAYVEFSSQNSLLESADRPENLGILRTLSKAYGLAGARCGILIACPAIIDFIRRIMPPYPMASTTQEAVADVLSAPMLQQAKNKIANLLAERERLAQRLRQIRFVEKVWPSDANFLLLRIADSKSVVQHCQANGILLREFPQSRELNQCVRITVGTVAENDRLLLLLEQY